MRAFITWTRDYATTSWCLCPERLFLQKLCWSVDNLLTALFFSFCPKVLDMIYVYLSATQQLPNSHLQHCVFVDKIIFSVKCQSNQHLT